MKWKTSKIRLVSYMTIGVVAIGGGAGTALTYVISKGKNSSPQPKSSLKIISASSSEVQRSIFPVLHQEDFYSYIDLDKTGRPIATNKLIAKVINYVIDKSDITDGKVFFEHIKTNNGVDFKFKWALSPSVEYTKTYHFTLSYN